jgi:hypothetical protein
MSDTVTGCPAHTSGPQLTPEELGFDPDALREKYRAERDRRIRPDGNRQYQRLVGEFARGRVVLAA